MKTNSKIIEELNKEERERRNNIVSVPYTTQPGYEVHSRSVFVDSQTGQQLKSWEKERKTSVLEIPEGFMAVPVSAYIGPDGSMRGQHVRIVPKPVDSASIDNTVTRLSQLPAPNSILDDDLMVVYPLGDPHLGMLAWAPETGEDFNLNIATKELRRAVEIMVARAPSAKTALLLNLGDYYHAEDDKWRTKSGHVLDGDGRWERVAQAGEQLMRDMIDACLLKHEHVIVINLKGNHDDQSIGRLVSHLRGSYEKEHRVSIRPHMNVFQYEKFGKVLLGFVHGDKIKAEKLESIMSTDRPLEWGETSYRVWHTGHVHHIARKEFNGCVVETHRTLAGKDQWHHSQGYRSGQSLVSITYHKNWGEINRNTVTVEMVREDLNKGSES